MKRTFTTQMLLVAFAAMGWASEFWVDPLYYQVTNEAEKTVEVRTEQWYSGSIDLVIPAEVTDPDSGTKYTVTSIAEKAFWYSGQIQSVSLPASITHIGEAAFGLCYELRSIAVDANNAEYEAENNALYTKGKKTLLLRTARAEGSTYTTPSTVDSISSYAICANNNLQSVTLTENVKRMGKSVFQDTWSINSLTWLATTPPTVQGNLSLNYCSIYVPKASVEAYEATNPWNSFEVNAIGSPGSLITVDDLCFLVLDEWRQDEDSSLPLKVALIGNSEKPYSGDMVVPASVRAHNEDYRVTHIGEYDGSERYAFQGCTGLTSVTLPQSIMHVQAGAFGGCTSLTEIIVAEGNENYVSEDGILYGKEDAKRSIVAYPAGKPGATYTASSNVKSIRDQAFHSAVHLEEISLPAELEDISGEAFQDCNSLTSIVVDGKNSAYMTEDGVLYDKEQKELLTYPTNKTDDAFKLGESVETVANRAFMGTKNLTTVDLGNRIKKVESGAFLASEKLQIIRVGKGIEEIDYEAFGHCDKLRELHLMTCNTMDVYNILDGSPINEITLYVPQLQVAAYEGQDFKSVEGVAVDWMFEKEGLYYAIMNDEHKELNVIAHPGNGYGGNMVVPAEVTHGGETYSVTGLSERAFAYKNLYESPVLESISLPNTLVTIGEEAFYACRELTEIELPESLMSIGERAFAYCEKLTEFVIPDLVKELENGFIEGCSSLQSIHFGRSIEFIETYLLSGASALERVSVSENNAHYACEGGVLYKKNMYEIAYYPPMKKDVSFTAPAELRTLGINNKFLEILHINEALEDIYSIHCPKLRTITVEAGNALFKAVDDVLYGPYWIDMDDSVTPYVQLTLYPAQKEGTTFSIPESIYNIGSSAFEGNVFLEEIIIPYTVKEISYNAFASCDNISTVRNMMTAPSGSSLFNYGSMGEATLYVPKVSLGAYRASDAWNGFGTIVGVDTDWFFEHEGLYYTVTDKEGKEVEVSPDPYYAYEDEVSIPASVTNDGITYSVTGIAEEAFTYTEVTKVSIPKTVEHIGEGALMTDLISEIVVDSDNAHYRSVDHVLYDKAQTVLIQYPVMKKGSAYVIPNSVETIAMGAFTENPYIEAVTLGANVKTIGMGGFASCENLREVNMNNKLVTIGGSAFIETGIEEIELPSTVESLGNGCFVDCEQLSKLTLNEGLKTIGIEVICHTSIEELVIPNSVETLGEGAIHSNPRLTTLVIGSGLKTIGEWAFEYNEALTTVTCLATLPPATDDSFDGCPLESITLYVPKTSVTAYEGAAEWKDFGEILAIGGNSLDEARQGDVFVKRDNVLEFREAQMVQVYDMRGQLVHSGVTSRYELPQAGIYVVRTATQAFKIMR